MNSEFDNDKCRTDIFDNGEFVVALDIPKTQANALCRELTSKNEDYDFDWQYTGGWVCIRQLKRKDKGVVTGIVHHKENVSKPDMVNQPPHYKDASGIECIEVTQHMRFCEGNSFKYVYRADSKGNLIEDLKKAAWYAERSWNRNRTGNDRVHWLVKRRGEAIADSRDKEGKPFIAEVMRNIVNNRWWQAYDSLMTEIERLEAGDE